MWVPNEHQSDWVGGRGESLKDRVCCCLQGIVSRSVMFFGSYSDTKWGYYDRPLAFLLTWAAANVLCFFIIVTRCVCVCVCVCVCAVSYTHLTLPTSSYV